MAEPAPRAPLSLPGLLRDLVIALAGAGVALAAILHWVALPWRVDGPSMEPTLSSGDRVLVDLWSLRRASPSLGDVVLFEGPDGATIVKRVAARPGDQAAPPPLVPRGDPLEGAYWMLGDNPGESDDSRRFGEIPRHRIVGRVVWRYWPPSRAGAIR